jgi:coenzyme F420 hydrogenase subunit beta
MSMDEVLKGDLCSGCGLCQGVFGVEKIRMGLSSEGFLRPQVLQPLSISETELFSDFCPGGRIEHQNAEKHDPHWGPIRRCTVGNALDESIRHAGSSGGVISALAIFLLENGAVQGVIQTTALSSAPLKNVTVVSRTRAQVLNCAGSRYAPSAPLADLEEILKQSGSFLFIGKPCDVAALRALQRRKPDLLQKIPYALSFFCAGIPSQHGTHKILDRFGVTVDEVAQFRYRGEGWPGKTSIRTRDGREHSMTYAESWGKVLNRELQFRCKICPDGTGEFADIACADAWYGDASGYPAFDEADGRSLIIVRTERGGRLFDEAVQAGVIAATALDPVEIGKMQPYQYQRKSLILSRLMALRLTGRSSPRYHNLRLGKAALARGIRAQVKSFLGTLRRIRQE